MADLSNQNTAGGQYTTSVTNGTGADRVISSGPGRLCKLHVVTGGTASLILYDNDTAASGTIVFASNVTMDIGTSVDIQHPVANGICAKRLTSMPGYIVTYSKDTAQGR